MTFTSFPLPTTERPGCGVCDCRYSERAVWTRGLYIAYEPGNGEVTEQADWNLSVPDFCSPTRCSGSSHADVHRCRTRPRSSREARCTCSAARCTRFAARGTCLAARRTRFPVGLTRFVARPARFATRPEAFAGCFSRFADCLSRFAGRFSRFADCFTRFAVWCREPRSALSNAHTQSCHPARGTLGRVCSSLYAVRAVTPASAHHEADESRPWREPLRSVLRTRRSVPRTR